MADTAKSAENVSHYASSSSGGGIVGKNILGAAQSCNFPTGNCKFPT